MIPPPRCQGGEDPVGHTEGRLEGRRRAAPRGPYRPMETRRKLLQAASQTACGGPSKVVG